jgi:hypothetical protein
MKTTLVLLLLLTLTFLRSFCGAIVRHLERNSRLWERDCR